MYDRKNFNIMKLNNIKNFNIIKFFCKIKNNSLNKQIF